MWFLYQATVLPILISIVSVIVHLDFGKTEHLHSGVAISERKALAEFRILANDVIEYEFEKTDEYLLRWLKECDLDVDCANKILRRAKKWRKDHKVDSIINENITEIGTYSKSCNLDAVDNNGLPVLICAMGTVDARKLLLTGNRDRVIRYYVQWVEFTLFKTREIHKKMGKIENHPILIIDAKGFSLKQHACIQCVDLSREFVTLPSMLYPQSLNHIVVLSLPTVAIPVLRIAKSVMPEFYKKCLHIFGPNKEEWSKFLLTLIPSEQLTHEYGGTRSS